MGKLSSCIIHLSIDPFKRVVDSSLKLGVDKQFRNLYNLFKYSIYFQVFGVITLKAKYTDWSGTLLLRDLNILLLSESCNLFL